MSKQEFLDILHEYENDSKWWSLVPFEEKADLQDFMLWLEEQP